MYAEEFHVDEIRSWAWIAAASFAAIVLASILFAPIAKVRVANEATPPPPLTVPTVVPPVIADAHA
jgi:hypothetical protein